MPKNRIFAFKRRADAAATVRSAARRARTDPKPYFMKKLLLFLCVCLPLGLHAANRPDSIREVLRRNPLLRGGSSTPYIYTPQRYTPAPEGFAPFRIEHLGRHGSRHHVAPHQIQALHDQLAAADSARAAHGQRAASARRAEGLPVADVSPLRRPHAARQPAAPRDRPPHVRELPRGSRGRRLRRGHFDAHSPQRRQHERLRRAAQGVQPPSVDPHRDQPRIRPAAAFQSRSHVPQLPLRTRVARAIRRPCREAHRPDPLHGFAAQKRRRREDRRPRASS